MSGLSWFRMYVDFLEDPKMLSLAFEDQRHFIGVLALKASGTLDQECAPHLMNRIVAQKLWIDHSAITEVKRRLVEAGLIDDHWQPKAWNKRQFVSDHDSTNSERQRRFREKKKQPTPSDNGPSNALRNASVTPLDTDTDSRKETEEKNPIQTRTDTESAPLVVETTDRGSNGGEARTRENAPPSAAATPPESPTPEKHSSPKGTRLPSDFVMPTAWLEWAQTNFPRVDARFEADKFIDHWHAAVGCDATKANWFATWRNWIRRTKPNATITRLRPQTRDDAIRANNLAVAQAWLAKKEREDREKERANAAH